MEAVGGEEDVVGGVVEEGSEGEGEEQEGAAGVGAAARYKTPAGLAEAMIVCSPADKVRCGKGGGGVCMCGRVRAWVCVCLGVLVGGHVCQHACLSCCVHVYSCVCAGVCVCV